MTQLEVTIVSAGVKKPDPSKTLVWLSLQNWSGGQERLEFFCEHNDWSVQENGQKAMSVLVNACGLCGVEGTSEFVGKSIGVCTVQKIKKVIGIKQAPRTVAAPQNRPSQAKQDNGRYVYVISCTNTAGALCKIGIANSPERRLRQLSTSSPHALRLEFARFARDARGVEAAAHAHFARHRQNGEWFAVQSSTAISFVNDNINKVAA